MASHDPVLAEVDAEIARLENELAEARVVRAWVLRHRGAPTQTSPPPPAVAATVTGSGKRRKLPDIIREVLSDGNQRVVAEIVAGAEALGWVTTSPRKDQLVRNALRDMGEKVVLNDRRYTLAELVEPGRGNAAG